MSEPRHAMIYRDAVTKKWWLEIVVYDVETESDTLSDNANTIGPFNNPEEAENYADDNFQNTGFGIPVLDQEEFAFLSPPRNASPPNRPENN